METPDPSLETKYRKIVLPDGRYMIFYTFGDSTLPTPADVEIDEESGKPVKEHV